MNRKLKLVVVMSVLAVFLSVPANAQIVNSSMSGQVTEDGGAALAGAMVSAVHTPSGTRYDAVANGDGIYTIRGMRSGGPYEVTVSMMGYRSVIVKDVELNLGETYSCNVKLQVQMENLQSAVVEASVSKFAGDKTGPATNISNREIVSLPSVDRNINDIVRLSPYSNGLGLAGGDGRSVNFTVDGANFNNNFGLMSTLPGGNNPISMDAIEEVQVVIAPFDVRQTNFIGGGINAITKSGTNKFKVSAYTYHYTDQMQGARIDGKNFDVSEDNDRHLYGVTFGGPIVKDKLFFFTNFEYTKKPSTVNLWHPSADGVADVSTNTSRVTVDDMRTVYRHLYDNYGYDPGSFNDYPADETNIKALAKIDWNISDRHHLAVRYNYTGNKYWSPTNGSSSNAAARAGADRLSQYGMAFSNSCYNTHNDVHSASLDFTSRIGDNMNNQLLATYSNIADIRGSNSSEFPFIDILDGTASSGTIMPYISAGYELFSYNNAVRNQVITVKDDFSIDLGSHHILVGANYEHQFANNSYMRNGLGYYRYASLNDFLSQAAPESVCLTYGYNGNQTPACQVTFNQIGVYAQDEWNVSRKFKLDYGVRLDVLAFDSKDVMTNNAILGLDYGGRRIDTGVWPKPQLMVSPRLGFIWDVFGDHSLKVRGGAGLFTGRLPLVYFTNMPSNANMIQSVASVSTKWSGGKGTPDPLLSEFAGAIITDKDALLRKLNNLAPERFPLGINPEDGVIGSEVDGVDPDFRMPMVMKTSLAIDYQFPTSFPFTISAEGIYNKTVHGVRLSNYNIKGDTSGWERMAGADNRLIYPDGYKYNKTDAYVLSNTDKGYGYTANVTLNIRPIPTLAFMAAYTHTESKEITGMPGSAASGAFSSLCTVNGPQFTDVQRSAYVIPDRVIASLTWTCKSRREGFDTHFSIFYEGCSPGGYSFTYANDVNRDGSAKDLIYIPNSPDEIKFASLEDQQKFWAFVNQDSYLSKHKGEYAEAYAARAPWLNRIDLKLAQDFSVRCQNSVHKFQISADILNIGNLFDSRWGVPKVLDCNEGKILQCVNSSEVSSSVAPVYKFSANSDHTYGYSGLFTNCWKIQIGLRYFFN